MNRMSEAIAFFIGLIVMTIVVKQKVMGWDVVDEYVGTD